jgi:hypothetical protein
MERGLRMTANTKTAIVSFDVSVTKLVGVMQLYDAGEARGPRGAALCARADRAASVVEMEANASGHDVTDVIDAAYKRVYGSTASEMFAANAA